MIVVCAWCQVSLRKISPYDDQRTTHGVCSTCERRVRGEMSLIRGGSAMRGVPRSEAEED
jgi:hypothetical protein